jgi:hypothetical protein
MLLPECIAAIQNIQTYTLLGFMNISAGTLGNPYPDFTTVTTSILGFRTDATIYDLRLQ